MVTITLDSSCLSKGFHGTFDAFVHLDVLHFIGTQHVPSSLLSMPNGHFRIPADEFTDLAAEARRLQTIISANAPAGHTIVIYHVVLEGSQLSALLATTHPKDDPAPQFISSQEGLSLFR